jgi:mRNA interferase MazF
VNIRLKAGEVWFADLGIAAKSRPVLILACPDNESARDLVIVAPLTFQIRSQSGEVPLGSVRWLSKPSAVNIQGLASFHPGRLVRKLGTLTPEQIDAVKQALRDMLEI